MRFLIIGAGGSGGVHTRLLVRKHEVSVYDPDEARALALCAETSAQISYSPEAYCDCAVVCTPGYLHREIVEQQLALGRPVVCEKPLAIRPRDAVYLAEEYGERVLIAESQAYAGPDGLDVQRMAESISYGEYGDLVIWRVCAMTSFRPVGLQKWFHDFGKSGGAFLEGGVHMATVARVLFGEAVNWRGSVRRMAEGAPDAGTMIIDYKSGHQLVMQIGWGTEGAFTGECAPLPNSFGLIGSETCQAWWPGDNHEAMWAHLLLCLEGDAEPVATLDDAAGAVCDIWACYDDAGVERPDG